MKAAAPEDEIDAHRETGTFDGIGHAGDHQAVAVTVAGHAAIGLWRTKSRYVDVLEDQLVGRPGRVEFVDEAMTARDVRVALAQLRPEFRQVIVEMFYLGRSVTEIAQLLSIPESTVCSRSYYGLRQLRRLLSAGPGLRLLGRAQGDGS